MKFMKNKFGFTLLELMIVIAVSAFVLTPFTLLLTNSLQNEVKFQRTIDAQHELQLTFITLNEFIRGENFSNLSIIDNYHNNGKALLIDETVVFKKSGEKKLVYQDFSSISENTASEVVLSNYILAIRFTEPLEDEVIIDVDVDDDEDDIVDNTFTYQYSERN